MNPPHHEALRYLSRCTFQVASWDKRFVGDMARLGPYDLLTPKQEANVERLTYRYRKQLKRQGYNVPGEFVQALAERKLAEAGKNLNYSRNSSSSPNLRSAPAKENPQLPLLEPLP